MVGALRKRGGGHVSDDERVLLVSLPGGVEMCFRRIPAGSFWMGSREDAVEQPIHLVHITKAFYLGETPVTQLQYKAMASGCLFELTQLGYNRGLDPSGFPGDNHPVENVSWEDTQVLSTWLTHSGLLPVGWVADLPSEAQWEYACRAGTDTEFHTGEGESALQDGGWFEGNVPTWPVARLAQNSWGLFDMHGNVYEWCRDVWDQHAYGRRIDGAEDPESLAADHADSRLRVLRGGALSSNSAWSCRAAYRSCGEPFDRSDNVGFRVGLFPGPPSPETASER